MCYTKVMQLTNLTGKKTPVTTENNAPVIAPGAKAAAEEFAAKVIEVMRATNLTANAAVAYVKEQMEREAAVRAKVAARGARMADRDAYLAKSRRPKGGRS